MAAPFMNLCRLFRAPLGLPKCTRSAICLTDRVVSCRKRAASANFLGWLLDYAWRSFWLHCKRANSSNTIRSALASAVSNRVWP